MAKELGPIDLECDAPPYPVVRACVGLGFHTPQDVRWQRHDRRRPKRPVGLFPWLRGGKAACPCGRPVAELESYTFTFVSGSKSEYYLAQCRRCHTIFWDED
jgi:hypothetical protein